MCTVSGVQRSVGTAGKGPIRMTHSGELAKKISNTFDVLSDGVSGEEDSGEAAEVEEDEPGAHLRRGRK